MRKTTLLKSLLLLCALIVGSSAWAAEKSYTITFKEGTGTTGDSGTKITTIADIISEGASYVSSITDASNVYQARTGRGIKLGTSKANGSLTLNLAEAVTPTKITFHAMKYNDSETSITVNGKAVTDLTGDVAEYTVNYDGSTEVSAIAISTPTKRAYITKVTVYYDDGGGAPVTPTCATPTFSPAAGAYIDAQNVTISCATEGATIYYTIDGTDPTTSSSVYSTPIAVSTTTTIKAMAVKDGFNNSTIASAIYTFLTTTYNTIAELIAAAPTEPVILNLTDAQVLGVGTSDMYIKDESEGLDLYNLGLTYTAGQILNGKVVVKTYTVYNGMPEITAIGENQLVATEGVLPEATVLANGAAATLENYKWQFVTVTGNATATNAVDGLLMYKKLMNYSNLMPGVDNLTATGLLIPYKSDDDIVPELLPTSIICHITLSKDMVTYSSNNKLDFTETGLTVYSAKVEDGVAKLTEITEPKVTNKKGIILAGTAGQTYDVPFNTEGSTTINNNELFGVVEETAVAYSADSKYNYILQDGVFKKATGAKLKAGKAYLSTTYDVTTATGAARLNIVIDGEATGIKAIENQKANSQMFDLQGRRVAQPTKGLYIVNGKKILVK